MLKNFVTEFKENYNSPISNLFYGIFETKSQCTRCNVIKFDFQVYSFLEFPLQDVNNYFYNNGKRNLYTNDGKNPDVDLYECFEYYQKIEPMAGNNQMHCNICNRLNNANYQTLLYSSPNYLILILNRGRGVMSHLKMDQQLMAYMELYAI